MGAQESKIETPIKEKNEVPVDEKKKTPPTPPILTPIDPRSPSVNIARTPVEILKFKTEDSQLDSGVVDSPKHILLGIDPRSPTVDFTRTPIVIAATKPAPSKLLNKNLDNVRNSLIQTTPPRSVYKHGNIVPPKLLESSPLTISSLNVAKRKSFVGLLETNIDFTETDLDQAALVKHSLNKSQQDNSVKEDACENVNDEIKPELVDHKIVPKDVVEENVLVENQDSDPIENAEQNVIIENEHIEHNEIKQQVIEDKSEVVAEKSINITAHIKDFDKKLTNLIYQDESEDDSSLAQRFHKLKENNRAPLATRNGNGETKKPLNKLRVSDKPTKKTDLSKIPVFKDIKKKGVQCENTPPRKMEAKTIRNKISRWDADKTLVI